MRNPLHSWSGIVLLPVLAVVAPACSHSDPADPVKTGPAPRVKVIETAPLHIDRIYTSMAGPFDRLEMDVSDVGWVTALKTEVVDADSGKPMGDEFFCHSQVQLPNTTRLMVTATGIGEIRFPEGFGMPFGQILGALPERERTLTFLGMVLNNHEPAIDRQAKIRATLEYWRPEEVGSPPRITKLYKVGLPMTVEDLEAYTPQETLADPDDASTHCTLVGGLKGHWLVPPGKQITRKVYHDFLAVDATAHYAVVHLHNYGVYMRLVDKTTGEELWRTTVVYEPDRKQIKEIPVYSSVEGFPLYRDHVYEIEALYDNTTDHDVDAMATIYLYYHPNGDENIFYPTGPFAGS